MDTHDGTYASATKIANDIEEDIKRILSASPSLKVNIFHGETLEESRTQGLNTKEIMIDFLFLIVDLGGSNATTVKDRISERLSDWLRKSLTQCNIEWSFELVNSNSLEQ